MSTAKIFVRSLLGIILLASVLGIALMPSNAHAASTCGASCTFEELGSVLPNDLQNLTVGGRQTLQKANTPDTFGLEDTVTQVEQAINTMQNTPEWVALGNKADAASNKVMQSIRTLQARAELSTDAAIQKANAAGDTATAASLMQKKANDIAVANGTKTYSPTCSGVLPNLFNPVCWVRTIATVVSSLLISVAAWALAIAGVLFNWTLMNTVILFKDVIFGPIENGINIGWTAFRDISNIVIIGVFTFIAISIILGNKEFGQKKLVARVLVIAILINFSLLFTKLIIDASNFTAGQFYAATQGGGKTLSQIIDAERAGQTAGASGVNIFSGYAEKQSGIAGQFTNFLGITSIADTYSALDKVANQNDSGWIMLVHALFAMVLLLGAAIVLFYGSFLLISRAIILIFLLLTSAIAFASHLIPKMSDRNYDAWGAWWKSLLESAVLAPLLMIFLYITLQIASSLKANNGTLGNLISGSATGGDINALFSYLLVLGLLFGSFKLASQFSAKIGGFNFAAMVPAIPLALGARFAGFVGKQSVGRVGTMIGEGFAERAKAAGPGTMRSTMFDMAAQTFKKAGKRDFNVANTGFFGKEIVGRAGLKGVLTGQTKSGGFEGYEKRVQERAAARAERVTYTQPELQKMAKTALAEASTSAGGLVEDKPRVQQDYSMLKQNVQDMRKDKEKMGVDAEKIRQEIAAKGATPVREAALAEQQSAIESQDQRIKEAEKRVGDFATRLADISKRETDAVEKALPKGSFALDEKGNVKLARNREGQEEVVLRQTQRARTAENAVTIAHNRLSNLPFVFMGQQPDNDRIAKKMRKVVEDQEMAKNVKKALQAIVERGEEAQRHERREDRRADQTREHQKRMESAANHGPSSPSTPPNHGPSPTGGPAGGHQK